MSNAEYVLVTGGAGGIGEQVCTLLAAAGRLPLVAYHRHQEAAEALAARLGGCAIALDLADPASVAAACASIVAQAVPLAGVVLAASPPPSLEPFGKISAADMQYQWQVNVLGPQQLLAELVRHCLRARKRGSIVGVLTAAMGQGIGTASPNMGAYLIAKHGLQGVLASAAADYPWLRVGSVSPGFTDTPMLGAFDARYLAQQRERQPFLSAQQVAQQIVDLLLA